MQKLLVQECRRLGGTGVVLLCVVLSGCAADAPVAPDTTPATSPAPPAAPAPGPATPASTGPGIHLSATEICFTPTLSRGDARPDDVRITSNDGSPIDGLTASIIYDAGTPEEWLAAAFEGASAPARLWLSSSSGGMPPGTYKATVTVSSTTPGVAPVSIRVTLDLRPLEGARLTLNLATVGLGGAGNGRLTATGIDCLLTNGVQGGDCEEVYATGTVVHVTAVPAPGQAFYLQGCTLPSPCNPAGFDIRMTESLNFEGGFGGLVSKLVVDIQWESARNGGLAFVDGPHGIICGHRQDGLGCVGYLNGGVGEFPLYVEAQYGARFLRWEGSCLRADGSGIVDFDTPGSECSVTAVFGTRPTDISLLLRGEGASATVTASSPATGPDGGSLICELLNGAQGPCGGKIAGGVGTVTFTAVPAPGSVFVGWNVGPDAVPGAHPPDCTGSAPVCTLTLVQGGEYVNGIVTFAKGN